MKEKRGFKDTVIRPARDYRSTNRLNQLISNKYAVPIEVILLDITFLFLLNYIVNSFMIIFTEGFVNSARNIGECLKVSNGLFNWQWIASSQLAKKLYLAVLIFLGIMDVLFVYQIKTSLSDDYFNLGQKGQQRFTTIDEIKKQYKEIPDKNLTYSGIGGTIISRYKDKLYIDTSNTNNLIIGMTRSGKGEFFVIPSIDVYSRAQIQSSLLLCDPKLELYRSSKKTLEERGYKVLVLNLIDPLSSCGYNPLSLIIEYYKKKMYDEAELMSDSFAFSVFRPDKAGNGGNDKFFDKTAAGVFSALILAHIKDCLQEDEILNQKRYQAYKEKTQAFVDKVGEDEDIEEALKARYWEEVERVNDNEEDVFLSDSIKYIPNEVEFFYVNKYEKCINVYSILNTMIELSQISTDDDDSLLDEFFRKRQALDPGKMRYASALIAGYHTKGSILANATQGLEVFQSRAIARMTAESTFDFDSIGFGDKPVAIFMGIPDFDRSKHFLATVFIRQVYYYLAKKCSMTTGKCKRPVKFICDEFGNMPEIDDMENMITVCLGRNISFDMYIQDYSQLQRVYGDAGTTIESNCGNQIYILGNGYDTAEKFSKLLGNKTRINIQRDGSKLSLKKHQHETLEEEPLLDPNRLMNLLKGECVIVRSMKREDLKGNDVVPYPIFNSVETNTRLKYRYEYLQDSFPNAYEINLKEINHENRRYINPEERTWDFTISFKRYEEARKNCGTKVKMLSEYPETIISDVLNLMKNSIGEEEMSKFGITEYGDIPISQLVDIINKNPYMETYKKNAILSLFKGADVS